MRTASAILTFAYVVSLGLFGAVEILAALQPPDPVILPNGCQPTASPTMFVCPRPDAIVEYVFTERGPEIAITTAATTACLP